MPDLRKCVVWSVLFALVSYVAYYQLQETTNTVTSFVIVPAKRREVSEHFLERPEAFSDFHPNGIGVRNVQRTMSEEDPQKIKELRFIMQEKLPLPFPFQIPFEFDLKLEYIEPDAHVKYSAMVEFVMGLIKLRVNGTFLLAEYKSKKESGTVVVEILSGTALRFFANQVFLTSGPPAHRKILQNMREFFVRKQQE